MDDELKLKASSFFNHVKSVGSKRFADREKNPNFEKPIWFDSEKFQIGNKTGRDYFFSIFTAHLSGLVILVYNQSILETLISTGNSQNIIFLFKRYLNTAIHVKKWYEGDIFDSNNNAFKSIVQIRSIHRKVMDERNKDLQIDKDILKFSQFDMFMTQFAFLGQIINNGQHFGLKLSDEQLTGLIHFWRCIGNFLGMEDQFNLFNIEDLNFQRYLCNYILENQIKPTVANCTSQESKMMSYGICASMKGIVSLIYANTFLKYSLLANDLVEEASLIKMNFFEQTLFKVMSFTFGYLYRFETIRKLLNRLLNMSFDRTEQQFTVKSKRLLYTYPNICIDKKRNDFTVVSI